MLILYSWKSVMAKSKMSESQDKRWDAWEPVKFSGRQVVGSSRQVDPWDMLNNFCFHVYAQKSGNGFFLP